MTPGRGTTGQCGSLCFQHAESSTQEVEAGTGWKGGG